MPRIYLKHVLVHVQDMLMVLKHMQIILQNIVLQYVPILYLVIMRPIDAYHNARYLMIYMDIIMVECVLLL